MTNRRMERCSTLLIIRKQSQPQSPSQGMAVSKKSTNKECWRECGERESCTPLVENRMEDLQNKTDLPHDPETTPGYILKENKSTNFKNTNFKRCFFLN